MKKKLSIIIERGNDMYGAWAENLPGIYAAGDTIEGVKKEILQAISLYKKHNTKIPIILEEAYEIDWKFDTASFLKYVSGIFTKAALERLTGINQKQLGHYASGLKKPRKQQVEKINKALHAFVEEMRMVELV